MQRGGIRVRMAACTCARPLSQRGRGGGECRTACGTPSRRTTRAELALCASAPQQSGHAGHRPDARAHSHLKRARSAPHAMVELWLPRSEHPHAPLPAHVLGSGRQQRITLHAMLPCSSDWSAAYELEPLQRSKSPQASIYSINLGLQEMGTWFKKLLE